MQPVDPWSDWHASLLRADRSQTHQRAYWSCKHESPSRDIATARDSDHDAFRWYQRIARDLASSEPCVRRIVV